MDQFFLSSYFFFIIDFGQIPPTVSGCNNENNQTMADTTAILESGDTSRRITWRVPSATPAGTPVRTHNGLDSGDSFEAGLTEIIYIFGNQGAESTCTWRVYVLSM